MFIAHAILFSDHRTPTSHLIPNLDSREFGGFHDYSHSIIGRQAPFTQCFPRMTSTCEAATFPGSSQGAESPLWVLVHNQDKL